MSTGPAGEAASRRVEPAAASLMLRVQTVFRVADEQHGQAVAAKMIDRAHEIANLPECECDVDVSVEWLRPDGHEGSGGVQARWSPAER